VGERVRERRERVRGSGCERAKRDWERVCVREERVSGRERA